MAIMARHKAHVEVIPVDYKYSFGNQNDAKRIDKAVFCEHQPPFSGMASGAVFAVLILDNSLLIQKIHKADFIFPSV